MISRDEVISVLSKKLDPVGNSELSLTVLQNEEQITLPELEIISS